MSTNLKILFKFLNNSQRKKNILMKIIIIIMIINKRKVNKENVNVFESLYFFLLNHTTIVGMCQNAKYGINNKR